MASGLVLSVDNLCWRTRHAGQAFWPAGSASGRAWLFKGDRPRRIDRYIDFFGSAVPSLAALAVRGSRAASRRGGTEPLPPNASASSSRMVAPSHCEARRAAGFRSDTLRHTVRLALDRIGGYTLRISFEKDSGELAGPPSAQSCRQ